MNGKLKELINDKLMVTHRQFEKETGLSRQTLYSILNGAHKPHVLTVKIICKYFNVDWKEYVEKEEEKL